MSEHTEDATKENDGTIDLAAVPRHRVSSYTNTYANHVEVRGSLSDINLVFCEIVDGVVIEEKCRVALGPIQAKLLVAAVTLTLQRWESKFAFTLPDIASMPDLVRIGDLPAGPTEQQRQP